MIFRFLPVLAVIPVLAACMMQSVESPVTACSARHVADVTFYRGKPSHGDIIAPEDATWTFGQDAGSIYVVCQADGETDVQKLPMTFTSCFFKHRLVCRGQI